MKLVVIADDLTGALDTGVQFAKRGIATEVRLLDAEEEPRSSGEALADSPPVVVVDTESRHISRGEARARVRDAARRAAGATGFYKKTDSTLRGNIGAELAGLMEGCPSGLPLVFAPAFPALKRTTRGGLQYVDGVPLEKTAFARDSLNPVTTADIACIIAATAEAAPEVLGATPGTLAGFLRNAAGGGKTVVVVDGEKEEDLAETAAGIRAAAGAGALPLMAGCAGFAAYLPELLDIKTSEPLVPGLSPPFLAVNGSRNPVSLSQVRAVRDAGAEGIRLEPEILAAPREGGKIIAEKIKDLFRRKQEALLYNILHAEEADEFTRLAAARGIQEEEVHHVLPQTYGEIVRCLAGEATIGVLVVFGGDTLVGILKALGKSSVIPVAEIFPGVVAARIPGVDNPPYIVTKAGGFGGTELLRKIFGL